MLSYPSKIRKTHADLAHLVERNLAKVEVAGSSPVIRSSNKMKGEINSPFFLFSKRKVRYAQLPYEKLGSFIKI